MNAAEVVEEKRAMNDLKTFRGRSLEEVLPQIKADLGPDAEIVRQREGLTGGVGGFFQRACIEVEARPGEEPAAAPARFDAYDEDEPVAFEPDPMPADPMPADPMPDHDTQEGLASPGIQEILRQAVPFADHLEIAASRVEPEPEPEPEPAPQPTFVPTPVPARPQVANAIETSLVEAGLRAELASEIVGETVSHLLP